MVKRWMLEWSAIGITLLAACGQIGGGADGRSEQVAWAAGKPKLRSQAYAEAPREVPVVMVAGIFDTGDKMIPVDQALARRGYTRRYRIDLIPSDGTASLAVLGRQLKEAVDRIRRETESPRINLVAFSMGAIVSRYYLQELGGVLQTSHFVSISAPHHGTLIGYARNGPGPREMRTGSAFLKNLNSYASLLETIPCLSLWTPFDAMIVPANSSVVPWAKNIAVAAPVHPAMLVNQRVHDEIDKWLVTPIGTRSKNDETVPAGTLPTVSNNL